MVRALIFGAGGVGCVYAYFLHQAGVEVSAICRTNYEVVRTKGIIIKSKMFGRIMFKIPAFLDAADAAEEGHFDYIIVCSKAFPGISQKIQAAVSPSTTIVLAQNGIDVEREYAARYPYNTIVSGVVYLPVTQSEPGVVEHGSLERFEIGTYPANTSPESKAKANKLAELFTNGGGTCVHVDDVRPKNWLKVAINASWNPICALTLCDDANFLRSSSNSEAMVRKIMSEVGRVAAADGYPMAITEDTINSDIQRPISRLKDGGKEPSMLTDVRAGRPIEVEAILGNTYRIAQKHGVETPYLELLYTLAKARNYSMAPDKEWKPIARIEP